jgi:hypothetical protein
MRVLCASSCMGVVLLCPPSPLVNEMLRQTARQHNQRAPAKPAMLHACSCFPTLQDSMLPTSQTMQLTKWAAKGCQSGSTISVVEHLTASITGKAHTRACLHVLSSCAAALAALRVVLCIQSAAVGQSAKIQHDKCPEELHAYQPEPRNGRCLCKKGRRMHGPDMRHVQHIVRLGYRAYAFVTLPLALQVIPTKSAQLGREEHAAAVSFASAAYGSIRGWGG